MKCDDKLKTQSSTETSASFLAEKSMHMLMKEQKKTSLLLKSFL